MQPGERNPGPGRSMSASRNSLRLPEDYDYDSDTDAVADGFRPSPASAGVNGNPTFNPSPSSRPDQSQQPRPAPSTVVPLRKGTDGVNRPPSTSKHIRPHDSLTLRNDGLTASRNGLPSSSSSTTQVGSQFSAANQPSHPYQMYPQRTYSNATSSTEPLSSAEPYAGPRGPTHPYAMYIQNTSTPEDPAQAAMPVEFNDMDDEYRRQRSPDGEGAAGSISPLGHHMEEPPPYTRYPEQAYAPKPVAVVEAAAPIHPDANATSNSTPTVAPPASVIPGAGGIGLATRNPEFSSTEDDLLSAPHRTGSVRSVPSVESYHQLNGAARDHAEKPAEGKWHRRAKKKLWGVVPYWALCLLLSGIVIMGVVMGTVIGTIVSRQRAPRSKEKSSGQKSTPNNVQFMQQYPLDLPPLDTGCFALPPMERYQVPKACIKDASQSPAWSCDTPFRWYSMNVTSVPDAPDTSNYALKLAPFDPKASRYMWGSQPPDIAEFQRLYLVKDMEEKSRGPAWYLEVEYNKTVILREDQLQAPAAHVSYPTSAPQPPGAEKRHLSLPSSPVPDLNRNGFLKKSFAAAEGDKPWICTWPKVRLQVFIFPNQTFISTKTTSSAGPASTASSDASSPTNYREPYSKLVKFVERRPGNAPEATCSQYTILDGGRAKILNYDDKRKPITIKIDEVSKSDKRAVFTDRSARWSPLDASSLQERDVDLTPCGCVSFSWSV